MDYKMVQETSEPRVSSSRVQYNTRRYRDERDKKKRRRKMGDQISRNKQPRMGMDKKRVIVSVSWIDWGADAIIDNTPHVDGIANLLLNNTHKARRYVNDQTIRLICPSY